MCPTVYYPSENDPTAWYKSTYKFGPCCLQPLSPFVDPPEIPKCRTLGPSDEAWYVAREQYFKEWDAAHLALNKAKKQYKAWEEEQRKPRADGKNVLYLQASGWYGETGTYKVHALKVTSRGSYDQQEWINLRTLSAPEVKEIFEDNAIPDYLPNDDWAVIQSPQCYLQLRHHDLENLPPKLKFWRPRCRNYPLGHIMESSTEGERHRALTLCLEVAITAAGQLVQSKDVSDALMKRCQDNLRLLKKDEGCRRYTTAKSVLMTLLAVHVCAGGARDDCKTSEEADREWTTNCSYRCNISFRQRQRGAHDPELETRCFCRYARIRRKSSILHISVPGYGTVRKIGSLQETQSDFMQIMISQFAKSQAEIRSLMILHQTEADGSRTVGISITARIETLPAVIGCLEVMESVAKVIPGFGGIAEGACATLRKILSSAESVNACRAECLALAEHTALITCAIFNEVAASPALASNQSIVDLLCALQSVKKSLAKLEKISSTRYFVTQVFIKSELRRLRDSVSDACLAFGIRSDLSARQILDDLKAMQTTLLGRVEEIRVAQVRNHDEIIRKQDLMQRQVTQLEHILRSGLLQPAAPKSISGPAV